MKLTAALGAIGLVLVGAAATVSAHHAFAAEFDANRPLTLKGTVTKMEWVKTGSYFRMDPKGARRRTYGSKESTD